MSKQCSLILLFLLFQNYISGQIDSILSISEDSERFKSFTDYLEKVVRTKTYELREAEFYQTELKLRKKKLTDLEKELWFFRKIYPDPAEVGDDMQKIIKVQHDAIREAEKKGWKYNAAQLHISLGVYLFGQGKYDKSFEHIVKAVDYVDEIGLDIYPQAVRLLDSAADVYYRFGEYETARKLYRQCLAADIRWLHDSYLHRTYNTVGLCYQTEMKYDSAIYYFELAKSHAEKAQNEFWISLIDGNKAFCLYQLGQFDAALPLLIRDYTESIRHNEPSSAVNAAMIIATIYIKRNDYRAAEPYLRFAEKNLSKLSVKQKAGYYKNLIEISRLKNDFRTATLNLDSFLIYKDSIGKIEDARIIQQAQQRLSVEKHANEIKMLELNKKQQIWLRNVLLIFLILSGIISGLIINRIQLNRKRKLEIALMEKQIAFKDLEKAKEQLNQFTAALKEKNELIQSVKMQLSKLSTDLHTDERIDNLNTLLNANIITDEDWKQFRSLFEKVYPGYMVRLKEKIPDLSPAELRLCVLTKLNINQKDMASMLGVSYDAIRKGRQRLKNKLSPAEDTNIDELIQNI